jgi:hypothetical protein
MNGKRRSDPNLDRSKSPYYTKFVEELAGALDLNAGLAEALMNARYAALSAHIAEALDLDAGLLAALRASPPSEGPSRAEMSVSADVASRTSSSISPVRSEDVQEATEPGSLSVHEALFADDPSSPSSLVGFQGPTRVRLPGLRTGSSTTGHGPTLSCHPSAQGPARKANGCTLSKTSWF